jgi:hypothetical protein
VPTFHFLCIGDVRDVTPRRTGLDVAAAGPSAGRGQLAVSGDAADRSRFFDRSLGGVEAVVGEVGVLQLVGFPTDLVQDLRDCWAGLSADVVTAGWGPPVGARWRSWVAVAVAVAVSRTAARGVGAAWRRRGCVPPCAVRR